MSTTVSIYSEDRSVQIGEISICNCTSHDEPLITITDAVHKQVWEISWTEVLKSVGLARNLRTDWAGRPKFLVAKVDGEPLPEQEPVFVLRGQDILAPLAVRAYADAFLSATGDRAVAEQIRAHANDMQTWPNRKIPD